MENDCRREPSEDLLQGIATFNAGEWFECHEILEELWVGESGEARDLYQGVLQVAVALHHWREGNYRGAMHLLASGVKLLHHVEPVCQGVDVAALIAAVGQVRESLEALGPERMAELDRQIIPRVSLFGS
ncbi:MAG TPA: DUF309 domain-containing protein [Geobacteraceae bacterium]